MVTRIRGYDNKHPPKKRATINSRPKQVLIALSEHDNRSHRAFRLSGILAKREATSLSRSVLEHIKAFTPKRLIAILRREISLDNRFFGFLFSVFTLVWQIKISNVMIVQ